MSGKYNDPSWIGKKYHMLTVIGSERVKTNLRSTQWHWRVRCDCGNEKVMKPIEIIKGKNVSCGCYRRHKPCPTKTHGESHTPLHNVWCGMNDRCNPEHAPSSSERYGKRGIQVCEEWKSYIAFAEWARANGYEKGMTIERIDVNGNYCPENCTWIPAEKQARNRRTTSWVEYEGRTMSLAEACEIANLPYKLVWYRIHVRNWTFKKAISTPVGATVGKNNYERKCIICNKDFISNSPRAKYCSHDCYLVYRTMKRHENDFIFDKIITESV